ncbi:MAG: flagellar basal body rod protein FlgB [Alphaproteobacteria bacterium]|jgi:flagellar basal-body rod protein FlgB|nr:flagellar basal body rod protein FlgB [Alphaproteobacteria bacterium]MBT7942625.1 flagellar basal body rod protein FlgB [Alphaproteobacteria bacterium]
MDFSNVTLFNMVKKRMAWLGQRQEVVAQNIANADTPGYKARDVKGFQFKEMIRSSGGKLTMASTSGNHLRGQSSRAADFGSVETRHPFETNPNGNSVVLEEQMAKMGETSVSHRLTSELYKKHLGMIRTALGRR